MPAVDFTMELDANTVTALAIAIDRRRKRFRIKQVIAVEGVEGVEEVIADPGNGIEGVVAVKAVEAAVGVPREKDEDMVYRWLEVSNHGLVASFIYQGVDPAVAEAAKHEQMKQIKSGINISRPGQANRP